MNKTTKEYWDNRPEIYQMTFEEFPAELFGLLPVMKSKEGAVGNLDPYKPGYMPMTESKITLHEKDWKAFSRGRGFSEYDIAEYARWHKITGQTDVLKYAFNDLWRRPYPDMDRRLYLRHIEFAKEKGAEITPQAEQSYLEMESKEEQELSFLPDSVKIDANTKNDQNDVGFDWNEADWVDGWDDEIDKVTINDKISKLKSRLAKMTSQENPPVNLKKTGKIDLNHLMYMSQREE